MKIQSNFFRAPREGVGRGKHLGMKGGTCNASKRTP